MHHGLRSLRFTGVDTKERVIDVIPGNIKLCPQLENFDLYNS